MQYALIKLDQDKHSLVDASEINALESGLESVHDETPENDDHLELRLVYGRYMPNPMTNDSPTKGQSVNNMKEVLNKWMVYLENNHKGGKHNLIYLGIEDIKPLPEVALTSNCGHCPEPHATDDIAFAALVAVPPSFEFHSRGSWARSTFLRWHDLDPLTNLINRNGIFALIAEDKSYQTPVTADNWLDRVNPKRAVKVAQRIR